ncbi:hypothetical protein T552_01551 [Pneumocystis carinii B80]|uniref:Uncharacterized protein n=1 Tax=Pneumocystis carinii (strain B80) TaxID=1408658 RepID=A0A0W4ZKN5_PNEC8|nr:hypothetical protein T552_01551 [Pneumocystis carinii B80]KTW28923.1 hypothetical protein T552_01551 [Pneumocystis carinii B80]
MVLHIFFCIKKWMIVVHTSLLFITITNAYPASIPVTRDNHRALVDSQGSDQKTCSINDPTLSIHPSLLTSTGTGFADCLPGRNCLFVCKSGYLSTQYDASYYPEFEGTSVGNVLCTSQGTLQIAAGGSLCALSTKNLYLTSLLDYSVSFCQKISVKDGLFFAPNSLQSKSVSFLAVSGQSHQSSLYYFNPLGTDSTYECPITVGSSSPYILEIKDINGEVHISLGWNPFYISNEEYKRPPNWGLRVLCQGVDCDRPCFIDPTKHGINECENCEKGSHGSSFCTVKVSGSKEAIVFLFSTDGDQKTYSYDDFSSFTTTREVTLRESQGYRYDSSRDSGKSIYTEKGRYHRTNLGDLKEEEDQLTQEEKDLIERLQKTQQQSKLFGDQNKQPEEKADPEHHSGNLGVTVVDSTKESAQHQTQSQLKGSSDDVNNQHLDLVYLKDTEKENNGHLDDFKGFVTGKTITSQKDSHKDIDTANKATTSLYSANDSHRTDKCKSLIDSIVDSVQELCLLLKSKDSDPNSSKKQQNPQLDVISPAPDSIKQENSAIHLLKPRANWILIFLGFAILL